jgi:hypothetical protein
MRRLAAAALLAITIWLPTVSSPPVVQAAACTGWSSTTTPPPTIRVLRTGTGVVETVDFKTYVKVVMPAEWPSTWSQEVFRAGAVAIKQYAWYYTMHYRGGTGTGGCYDVRDDSNDQVYSPTRTQYANQIQAVESTWAESITRGGVFVFTGYRPGTNVACGADAHTLGGNYLMQHSALNCAIEGKTGEQILEIYYGPGLVIQGAQTPPGAPTAVSAAGWDTSALVRWSPPASDGNATITTYAATSTPDGKTCTSPGGLSCYVGGLTNGQAYTFTVTATNNVGTGPPSGPSASATPQVVIGGTYHALTPTRVLDTRDGTGGLSGPFSSHVARTFQVTGGTSGVPTGATAVTGNLTVTQQMNLGYLSIGPNAQNYPTSSTLNFPVNDDRANAVTVALGGTGTLSVTYAAPTSGPTAQVIFDVTGYFTPDMSGATYHALAPTRILDSRDGTGGLSGPFSSHVARTFTVIGHGGVPSGATAVTGNLTVTGQTSLGYLSIGPVFQNNPTSSTLNFPINDDRANGVTVALSAGGTLSVTYAAPTSGPTAHVIFDVTGYFTPNTSGATYVPLTPTRILDSRDGTGGLSGPFSSHVARTFGVSGHGGVPSGATAVTGNLTVTQQSNLGFLFIGPVAVNNPTTSTLNFPLNDDRANAVTVALGGGGTLSVTYAAPTPGPTAHVIFDVTGYFVPTATSQ